MHQRLTIGLAVLAVVAAAVGGYAVGSRESTVHLSSNADASPSSTGHDAAANEADVTGSPQPPSTSLGTSALLARHAARGLLLRVTRQTESPQTPVGNATNLAGIPEECITTGRLTISVVTPKSVIGYTGVALSSANEPSASAFLAESAAGELVLVVWAVHVGDAIVSVRFPGGSTDSMTAVDGIAVLTAPVTTDQARQWRKLSVSTEIDGDKSSLPLTPGLTVLTGAVPGGGSMSDVDPPPPLDCTKRLPQSGEQPADVDAARAAVIDSFTRIYNWSTPPAERDGLIDDPSGVEAGLQLALSRFTTVLEASKWKFTDLVFTDPTTAVVSYDVVIPPMGGAEQFLGRFGTAKLIDGTWKVSRGTMCSDLEILQIGCPVS